jgi:hypothetical protein
MVFSSVAGGGVDADDDEQQTEQDGPPLRHGHPAGGSGGSVFVTVYTASEPSNADAIANPSLSDRLPSTVTDTPTAAAAASAAHNLAYLTTILLWVGTPGRTPTW